jgi:hypothetical protein
MSSVKISQLDASSNLNANPSQSLFITTDLDTNQTTSLSARALGDSLYSNNALIVGSGGTVLQNVVAQYTGIGGSYVQINAQNLNANGSVDYVLTADTGTDSTSFLDLGMNNSGFNDTAFSAMKALDGYLFVQGPAPVSNTGNLVIGTASLGANILFTVGGTTATNIVGRVSTSGWELYRGAKVTGNLTVGAGGSYVFSDGTIQSTAAASNAYSVAAFAQANTVNAYARSANTFLQTYAAANDIVTLSAAQSYTDSANSYIRSNYLANTTGTFAGDLTITGNTQVQSINTANMSVVGTANVSGTLNVVGIVSMNAQLVMSNVNYTSTQSAVTISASPTVQLPANDGYMIHISGKNGIPSRIVTDSYGTGAYALYAGRAARGTVDSPTALQSGDVISRFSSSGYGTTKYQALGTGRIDFIAAENFTDAVTGSQIQFWNCPVGSNTLTNIATFNGTSAVFSGEVNPQKGFVLTPNVMSGITTSLSIDIANNSLHYFKTNATTTISLNNFKAGKIVEVWLTNTDTGGGSNHTITHGCLANNSTVGATSFTLTSLHSAYIKYFSIDGDLANTFCQVSYS